MKKVPVKVFYVGLFLHRFDVYPEADCEYPLDVGKQGH